MKKEQIYAYAGKILRIDLNTKSTLIEPTFKYAKEWIGGTGIDQWLIYNEVKPWITPYAPANILTFGAGPLVGTLAPGANRLSAGSKNAMTLGVASSNSGSHFAPELKFAGYDQLIFRGKARAPVYAWIRDDRIEIRDATHLWGKATWETVDMIRDELGDERIQVVSIGPAGENIVRGACIIADKGRALGRCGLGGIMGSKNLKAIAVRGTGEIAVAEPSRFFDVVDKEREKYSKSDSANLRMEYGTAGSVYNKQKVCGIAYKNFQYLVLPEKTLNRVNLKDLQKKYMTRHVGYLACPSPCSRYYNISDGPYAGLKTEGFQFEALHDIVGKIAVEDPLFTIKLNSYCNQMGLDIDLVAVSIAWAMECSQRGSLLRKDTDGLRLEWGDAQVILELTRKIASREGFGDILAEGCAHAADLLGKGSEYAMHLKGQDLYEVIRGAVGWGLGACVSTRGGGHTTGAPIETARIIDHDMAERIFGVRSTGNPLAYEGKAKLVHYFERLHRITNSFGICHYASTWADPHFAGFPELAELFTAATGWNTTEEQLKRAATRMLNIEKAFNLLHTNLGREDDYPPRRDLEEPIPSGSAKGWKVEREKWDSLLDEYYELNSWDKATGYPTRRCLEELDLKEIADCLKRIGKLG